MKFVDEIDIVVRAGHGGPGSVHFLREKYRAFGGPDGGDGGRGGSIYFYANPSMQTLGHLVRQSIYTAPNGEAGSAKQCSGANAADAIIHVPLGTQVEDIDTGELVADMDHPEKTVLVASGGKGGMGNQHFATSSNQAPTYAQPGLPGEERRLRLNLKLIADAGLVGLPNAGKSTLIAAVTHSHPKIADYAFTTLIPNLGVLEGPSYRRVLLADIPGIIEGASRGAGLGLSFLRHIERVRVVIYVIDVTSIDPVHDLEMLRRELATYSEPLLTRPTLLVLNKMDEIGYDQAFADLVLTRLTDPALWGPPAPGIPVTTCMSAKEKQGTDAFVTRLFELFPDQSFAESML
ncbi:MAG: GTPase ObgE [Spirochaetia bacterium]|nr:GTPase ObgE [Spirochaetia bacterium]